MTTNSTISSDSASAVQLSEYEPGIVLMTLDMPNKGANILNASMFAQLDEAITPLLTRDDISGLILFSAKPKIFVAGADLVAIAETLDRADEEIIKFCDDGRAIMSKFSQTPFPTIAAIHGACVGGGLELALFCDRRVVSDHRTILGLPEAKLGLVPGWAGTIRVARICAVSGNENALEHQIDLVTSGRLINGAKALAMGFVDRVVPQDQLLQSSKELLELDFESGQYLTNRELIASPLRQAFDTESLVAEYGHRIVENNGIYPFAPAVGLEHMLRAAKLPMKQACDSESIAMAQVYGSPASFGLINNFFLGEHNKKNPGFVDRDLTPQAISEVGIVGAGVMGRAIASNNLKQGKTVRLLDSDPKVVAETVVELGKSSDAISAADDYEDFETCQLVIESAVENVEIKKSVFEQIEAAVSSETIIATNTSAIPISAFADSLNHPDRFCGIHFCHPQVMALVEIVKGSRTSKQTISTAVGYVRSIGKMPIVVHDRAGFVVNRLLSALLKQAFRLFTEGHSIESIDGAMREFGFRAGPFEMVDIIGADTCFYAGRTMWDAGLTCVSNSLILPRLVKLGRLGHKTNSGFYLHDRESNSPEIDYETQEQLMPYVTGEPNPDITVENIVDQILSGVVLEASNILEENIVADHRDIDLCAIHGFSFPPEHGGILFWADRIGIAGVVEQLNRLSTSDEHMKPNRRLLEMANRDETFYQT